ncbi:MAG: ankyrin repeat domain-containing protein, partial [Longimicrobiales bacterium]|nr:ankyrin repeat domain-containing protein [Longimicrobiales bacterium]
DLVGGMGGLSPLHHAAREGHRDAAMALVDAGAELDLVAGGDASTPTLLATLNGHFDLALALIDRGADPRVGNHAGVTPLWAAINLRWAPKALYPQPRNHTRQAIDYLDFVERLLQAGADPNAAVNRHIWFMSYNFDLLGVDMTGATPFWRAAYALDIPTMELLVRYGADPSTPTRKPPTGRPFDPDAEDDSGLPPVRVGGPGVFPIHAASGAGYGQDFAANSHEHVPDGWLAAVEYLVEVHGADVNARDEFGYTPVHHAAARGDNEVIRYLVEKGADVTLIARNGNSTVDMANGPIQRVEPFPETIALLESLGAVNNHNCLSCE